MSEEPEFIVERVQTGVRIEKRLLKVLKVGALVVYFVAAWAVAFGNELAGSPSSER